MFICHDDGTIYETFIQLEAGGRDLRFLCTRCVIGEGGAKQPYRNRELQAVDLFWNREEEYFMNNELYSCWDDVVLSRAGMV